MSNQKVVCRKLEAELDDFGVEVPKCFAQTDELSLGWAWEEEGVEPQEKAVARVGYRDRGLCFYAYLEDSRIYTEATENNQQLFRLGDVAEFFIKPGGDRTDYWEIHVSPNNLIMDIYIPDREKFMAKEITWDEVIAPDSGSKWRGEVVTSDQTWAASLDIPWNAFKIDAPPAPGTAWSFAVCRYNYPGNISDEPEISSTAPLTQSNFHRHEEYSQLVFE